jgi:WD40 repeat protein
MKSSCKSIQTILRISCFLVVCFCYATPINAEITIDLDSLETIVPENVSGVRTIQTIGEGIVPINCFAFNPASTTIAFAIPSPIPTITIWDFAEGEKLTDLAGHEGYINDLAYSLDGNHLVSGGTDRTVKLWNLKNEELVDTITLDNIDYVNRVAFDPGGESIAYAIGGEIGIWNITARSLSYTINNQSRIRGVIFDATGDLLAYGAGDGDSAGTPAITIISLLSDETLLTLQGHTWGITDMAFSPDGKQIATSSLDGTIRIWNSLTGEADLILKADYASVTSLAFNQNSTLLASGGNSGKITLWNLASDHQKTELLGHSDTITRVRFDSTGRLIGTSSRDGTIKLWGVS